MSWCYWILFIISAFAYPIAFIHEWLWWAVFIFPVIFFWVAFHNHLTFMQGCLWGAISWSMHLGAPLYGLVLKAHGPLGYRVLPVFAVLFYGAVCTGIWFWVTNQCVYTYHNKIGGAWRILFGGAVGRLAGRFLPPHQSYGEGWRQAGGLKWGGASANSKGGRRLGIWTLSIWCYFYFVSYWALAWGNRVEGLCLMNPLVPLAAYPPLLFLLPTIGAPSLLFLMFVACAAVTWSLKTRTLHAVVTMFVAVSPWIFAVGVYALWCKQGGASRPIAQQVSAPRFFYVVDNMRFCHDRCFYGDIHDSQFDHVDYVPEWVTKVVRAPVLFCSDADTVSRAHQMGREVMRIQQKNPDVELIIFPESCLYGLYDMRELCVVLYDCYVSRPLHIICGGFESSGGKWHNVFYWFYQGNVQAAFCKKHAVVLAEALPAWCQIAPVIRCYFQDMPQIVVGEDARPQFELRFAHERVRVVPYICSELFFNQYPDDEFGESNEEGGGGITRYDEFGQSYEEGGGDITRYDEFGESNEESGGGITRCYTKNLNGCRAGNCIIEIANDSWAVWEGARRLMLYGAIFKAIAWQRDIVYVSYYYGVYINKFGHVVRLA